MRKLALFAALAALVIAVPLSFGSSHREAPLTSIDPTGDDTDTYAFTAQDAPGVNTVPAGLSNIKVAIRENPGGIGNWWDGALFSFDDQSSCPKGPSGSVFGSLYLSYCESKTRFCGPIWIS